MKKTLAFSAIWLVTLFLNFSYAADYVKGHWKDTDRDGTKDTYVDGYHRSSPNNSQWDNYSTKGNYNPYTGKEGTVDPWSNNNPYGNSGNSDYGNHRQKRGW
jgi:hypothetical protein